MLSKKHIPKSALYELTLKCNMNCLHCGSSAGFQRDNELSTKQWNAVTEELVELGCTKIALLGGEPFLRSDWFEISQYIKDFGVKLIIITNGFLVSNKIIENLRKLDPYAVAISIDGATASTHDLIRGIKGSFKKCHEVISDFKNADIPATVITTVNRMNFNELPELRSQLINKKVAWQLQMAVPLGRFNSEMMITKEEFYATGLFIGATRRKYRVKEIPIVGAHGFGYFSEVLPSYAIMPNWRGCQAGITSIGIQSNGGVKGCLSLPEEFVQGYITEKSLMEIWNDPEFCKFTRKFTLEDLNGECKECTFGKKCKGGCLAASVSITGGRFCDPYCFRLIERSNSFIESL